MVTAIEGTAAAPSATPGAPLAGRVVEHQDRGPVPSENAAATSRARLWGARCARVARGVATAPSAFRDWRLATEYDVAIRMATAAGQAPVATAIRKEQEKTAGDRRARAAKFLEHIACAAVPVLFGGWVWFTVVALLGLLFTFALLQAKAMYGRVVVRSAQIAGTALALQILTAALGVHPSPLDTAPISPAVAIVLPLGVWALLGLGVPLAGGGKVTEWMRAGVGVAALADALYIGANVHGLSWAWSPWYLLPPALFGVPTAAWVAVWAWRAMDDGTIADDLRFGEQPVTVVAEPHRAEATEGNAVKAIAKGVGVKPEEAAAEVVIIGTPSRDSRGVWSRTHFQLQTQTIADLERKRTPSPMQQVAATLRRPSSWVYVERGGDESQGLLYVADRSPWPTEAIRWRGLSTLEHDSWVPEVVGIDMLTGEPVRMPVAETSDMCGASPGGGKTAWTRRELCLLTADPYAQTAVFDLKGDGALVAFEPTCLIYRDGDDNDTMRDLSEWLDWFRHDESARRKAALKRLVQAGICPDVRVTREIARNPEYQLPLLVVVVDEAQDGTNHPKYGDKIGDGLTYIAKQGRSLGARLKIRTQKPTDDRTGIPAALNSMLRTRIAGRAEDYQVSKATLLTSQMRADLMPEGVEGLFYLRLPDGRSEKIIAEYVDANDASDYVRRVIDHQRATGRAPAPVAEPEVPRVLTELRRLLTEPSRQGKMLTAEAAAALKAYGLVEVTATDRAGEKTDEQIAQEKVAALVKPFGVLARPDRDAGNRMAYWLSKEHREFGDVGVAAAIARLESGRPTGLQGVYGGSPAGSPTRRRLHAV